MGMQRKIAVGLLAIGALSAGALARPAIPYLVQKQQPDGSRVSVQEFGDENYHYETTSDGYLVVMGENGVRYFADENAEPSQYMAQDVGERSEKARAFLKSRNSAKAVAKHRAKYSDRYPDFQKKIMEGFHPNHGKALQTSVLMRPEPLTFTKGEARFPIFLVSSNDGSDERKFSESEVSQYNDQCNKVGYNEDSHYGSVYDYFLVSSKNQFRPKFDMVPVTVNLRMAVSGSDEGAFVKAVVKAGVEVIGEANLSKYDIDGDKIIDGFGVVLAGSEKNTDMWGHMYWYTVYDKYTKFNGYKFDRYFMIAQNSDNGAINGIGVMLHEFSHVLGLPDFYSSYNGEWVTGPTPYDVMTQGMYNGWNRNYTGQGRHPPKYSAFERESMGWMKVKELSESNAVFTLQNIDANEAYSITNPSNNDEFYVVEYRPGVGWDSEIKGEDFEKKSAGTGVYVWYINYDAKAWDYFPNQQDCHRYNLAAILVGNTSYSKNLAQFETNAPESKTYSTFSSKYNVYNMMKVGDERVCFATNRSVNVAECPAPVSSSSAAAGSVASSATSSAMVGVSSSRTSGVSSSVVAQSSSSRWFWSSSNGQWDEVITSSGFVPFRSSSSAGASGDAKSSGMSILVSAPMDGRCHVSVLGNELLIQTTMKMTKDVVVFDMQGNKLGHYRVDGANASVDVRGLGRGVRVVRVMAGSQTLAVQSISIK